MYATNAVAAYPTTILAQLSYTLCLKHVEKVTLRCQSCNLYYNYSMWGNKQQTGFILYCQQQQYIEVRDTIYFEQGLLDFQCSLG